MQIGMNKQIYVTKALRREGKDWVARNQDNVPQEGVTCLPADSYFNTSELAL